MSKRVRGRLLVLAFVLGCGATAWKFVPRERPLLEHATLITKSEGWNWEYSYYWLSGSHLLVGCVPPLKDEMESRPFTLGTYDIGTRKFRLLEQANVQIECSAWSFSGWDMSPDGKWLMVHSRGGTDVMQLDGTHFLHVEDEGRRVAYTLISEHTPLLLKWIKRFVPAVKVESKPVVALYVCRVNGEDLHQIGTMQGASPEDGQDEDRLERLQWQPDGRHLSFVYKDALYIVSAD